MLTISCLGDPSLYQLRTLHYHLHRFDYHDGKRKPCCSNGTTSGNGCTGCVQRPVRICRLLLTLCPAASRSHSRRDTWLEVHTFTPLGNRIFLPSDVPQARIARGDILSIFPSGDRVNFAGGMLELPPKAYAEYIELSSRMQEKYEKLFSAMAERPRRRR